MGRSGDKMYITRTEWVTEYGGAKVKKRGSEFKRLPFHCCSLSLRPAENPVCTPEGQVFDLIYIMPWIKKHGTNPVTSAPLASKDLLNLHLRKSSNGEYHCPVTFKVFNDHSHIVAIKSTGNVFSYDAIDRLCIKTKNMRDLLTDEPFTKKDIIPLQDPLHLDKQNINSFAYVKSGIQVERIEGKATENSTVQKILAKIPGSGDSSKTIYSSSSKPALTPSFVMKKKDLKTASYSTNEAAMSFTSTGFAIKTKNENQVHSDLDYMFLNLTKNSRAHVNMQTNFGDMNIELYAYDAPKTCYNFIMLAKTGKYDNVKFHRMIPRFMIQGGDPTATGRGGKSYFGKEFEDEIQKSLNHNERGILSMANKGPNTNTSQFFILYGRAPHLDGKHTVFGKIINGIEFLDKTEGVQIDATDKPLQDIIIEKMNVFNDPFEKFMSSLQEKKNKVEQKETDVKKRKAEKSIQNDQDLKTPFLSSLSSGPIGKYLRRS